MNARGFTDSIRTPVPDDDLEGVLVMNPVAGLEGEVLDVVVTAVLDHPSPGDLRIWLISPTGQESLLWPGESDSFPRIVTDDGEGRGIIRAPEGWEPEPAVGEWGLRLVDDRPGNVGELDRWSISFSVSPSEDGPL